MPIALSPYPFAFIPYFEFKPYRIIGNLEISVFGLVAAAGVYLAAMLTARAARKRGLDPKPLYDFALWGVLSGVVMGHLVHIFLYHPEELSSAGNIFSVWSGLSSFGGLLGGILAAVIFFAVRHLRFQEYADAFALGVAPGWGVARIGCFLIHDHQGVRTSFPLAVAFPGGPRHDLGLYDALWLFAIAGVLYLLARRRILEGRLLGVLAVLYAIGRFTFDTLRARPGDIDYADARYLGLTPAQYACFFLVGYAAWLFWTRRSGVPVAESQPAPATASARKRRRA